MEQIGKYEIVGTIGKGSMGVVYKGRDPEIGRVVAIKTLKSIFLGEDEMGNEALQRFRQESRSAGRLTHPNIVMIFEAGRTDEGSPYIVMEYSEGPSLEKIIEDEKKLPPLKALHYAAQLLHAIDYAHSQEVIHRDIKPSNVIVDDAHKIHLLDFGVAKITDTSLTPAGTVVGTPSYMSPEQIRGEKLDGRSDVFSSAVMIFEMFTGSRPFPGKDFTTVVGNIVQAEPLTFNDVKADLPAELETVIRKGLAKDREERFANGYEFAKELAAALGVRVDSHGLVGGFKEGMELEDVTQTARISTADVLPKTATSAPPKPRKESRKPAVADDKEEGSSVILKAAILLLVFALIAAGAVFAKKSFIDPDSEIVAEAPVAPVEEAEAVAVESAPEEVEATQDARKAITVSFPNSIENQLTGERAKNLSDGELAYYLSSPDTAVASLEVAIDEAGSRDDVGFLPYLIALSGSDNFKVRVRALRALSNPEFLAESDVFAAVALKLNDPEFLVRGFAVKALAVSKSDEVGPLLKERLVIEEHRIVKKLLTEALAER